MARIQELCDDVDTVGHCGNVGWNLDLPAAFAHSHSCGQRFPYPGHLALVGIDAAVLVLRRREGGIGIEDVRISAADPVQKEKEKREAQEKAQMEHEPGQGAWPAAKLRGRGIVVGAGHRQLRFECAVDGAHVALAGAAYLGDGKLSRREPFPAADQEHPWQVWLGLSSKMMQPFKSKIP